MVYLGIPKEREIQNMIRRRELEEEKVTTSEVVDALEDGLEKTAILENQEGLAVLMYDEEEQAFILLTWERGFSFKATQLKEYLRDWGYSFVEYKRYTSLEIII